MRSASSEADGQPLAGFIPLHLEPSSSHHLFSPRGQDSSIRWQMTAGKWDPSGARKKRQEVPPRTMMGKEAGTGEG